MSIQTGLFIDENDIVIYKDATNKENFVMGYIGKGDKITMPDYIDNNSYSVYKYAFNDSADIKSITIGEGVTNIDIYAFYGCTSLVEINFNAIKMNDLPETSLRSGNHVFTDAGKNSNGIIVNIGEKVQRIPAYLFWSYYTGSSVNVIEINYSKNSVCEEIGNYAFYNLYGLEFIIIPSQINHIGYRAFYYCNLQKAIFEEESNWWVSTKATATSGSAVSLESEEENATLLKKTYLNYYWFKG